MRRTRSSALILLAEIAAHRDLPVATRIAVGMSRDALLAVSEVEPLGRHRGSNRSATIAEVAQILDRVEARSPHEAARLRVAKLWLRDHASF
jgi:hypothetical protein